MLMQLLIQMPDKGASAVNFTLTGFDVVSVESSVREGKIVDWNRIDDKTTKFIVYGLNQDVIDNSDTITVYGYQTERYIKMRDVSGASPDAEHISIVNRYRRSNV